MTTRDIQRTDELIDTADMAVRISSQLRLWSKRQGISDTKSLDFAIAFLQKVLSGGRFVESKTANAGTATLEPLSWAVDIRIEQDPKVDVDYHQVISFVENIKASLEKVRDGDDVTVDELSAAASFFRGLGKNLGVKADEALRTPAARFFMSGDRYSY